MKKICQICGKSYSKATKWNKLRGKYNPTKRPPQKPNLQWIRLADGKRIKACTKCIKALNKTRSKLIED